MWLMVFFDLPVTSKENRRHASRFRNYLLNDGYMMLQYSVYARICNGSERVDKHLKRLSANLPPQGSVRALQITDKQFGRIRMLVGERDKAEETGAVQLLLL